MMDESIMRRLTEMAAEFRASGREPAVPRSAATVILIRPDMNVLIMRRLRTMAFGGMWAFPGGSLEPGETPEQGAARELLEETGVTVDRLVPWHRWLTPVFEPRRYDTWFYVAAMPDGQEPHLPPGEADLIRWITPADAVAEHTEGTLPMLPPTLMTLAELSNYDNVESVLSVKRDVSKAYTPEF